MPPQSILAYVAPRLTSQLENVVTDGLAYLLKQYSDVRNAFQKYVSQIDDKLPDSLKFDTQASWRDASRPDMVGRDDEGRRILIVESKFWASLTKNQPMAYIEQLAVDKPALLLFIAPKDRLPTLWQELTTRCGIGAASAQVTEEAASPFHVFILDKSRHHYLALTSWESLLEALTQQVRDSAALEDIRQLQSLCFSRTWPDRAEKSDYEKLIDALIARLVQARIASIEGYKAVRRPTSYKRYMTFNGLMNWCVEYNESHFERFYPSRLWLTKYLAEADMPRVTELLAKLTVEYHTQGKSLFIPLKIHEEKMLADEILYSLQGQIAEIASQLHQ
jgi:hypothetical protein